MMYDLGTTLLLTYTVRSFSFLRILLIYSHGGNQDARRWKWSVESKLTTTHYYATQRVEVKNRVIIIVENMSVMKRLKKELKAYQAKPVPFTGVEPSETDFHLWNCIIQITDDENSTSFPIHFMVEFPPEYPQKAPSVGFSTMFPYDDGASYVISDSTKTLNGKYVICMDLLGNFAHVHTEWEGSKGSGWSPAYDISSLLVILQVVVTENIMKCSAKRRLETIRAATEYANSNSLPDLNVPSELSSSVSSSSSPSDEKREVERDPADYSMFPPEVQALCGELSSKLADTEHRDSFEKLIRLFADAAEFSNAKKTEKARVFDPEIKCWYTQASYTEDTLGYGIQAQKKGTHWSLSTDCNLISRGAYDEGLRVQPNKDHFQFFLPSWINSDHAQNQTSWVQTLRKSIKEIGKHLELKSERDAVLFIFPEILNRMIVLMMDSTSDYRASENIFQCILNVWRTFLNITEQMPGLKEVLVTKLNNFINEEDCRRKDVTSNIGHALIMATLFKSEEVNWTSFLDAYDDESILRRVLWLQKDRVEISERQTFENAEISRKNILFQTMFKKTVISTDDMETVLAEIEASNCKLPEKLGAFLDEWRKAMQEVQTTPTWETHFRLMQKQGLSAERVDSVLGDVVGHYNRAIEKANTLHGYHYTNGGGGRERNYRGDRYVNRGDRGFDLKRVPCEDFLRGHCRFGDRCRKNHFE